MAKYDPDRIAALAAGLLEPAEAAALQEEIAADPRAAAELAAQHLALDTLRRAPAPVLSAEERSELRRAVAGALNLKESPAAAADSSRRRVPWRPIAVAAAALAALATVIPLSGLLSVGDDQTAMTSTAEADMTARTALSYSEEGLTGAHDDTDEPATLEEQAWSNTMAPFAADDQSIENLLADPASLIASADADLSACRAEAVNLLGEENHPAAASITGETGELVVWFVSPDQITVQSLAVFDPIGCDLLASHP
jgi:anti-sigma factor RsiW